MYQYKTTGTCSRQINIVVENNILKDVQFVGGCNGNLQGIRKLVIGQHIDSIIEKLEGIICRNNTSCPDQLAQALINYKKLER